jgi:hypothetical protein
MKSEASHGIECMRCAKVCRGLRILLLLALVGRATLSKANSISCLSRVEIGQDNPRSECFTQQRSSITQVVSDAALTGSLGQTLEPANPLSLYLKAGLHPVALFRIWRFRFDSFDDAGPTLRPREKDWFRSVLRELFRSLVMPNEPRGPKRPSRLARR